MARNKDAIANTFVGRKDIFADIVNYTLYHGRRKIKPEDLGDLDGKELISWMGKNGKIISKQALRDVFKSCVFKKSEDAYYMYIGVENQSEVNYAMIVKTMLYDILNYAAQVSEMARVNREEKELNSSEFLSGLRKEDKLIPVITITMLWKGCDWDGAKTLKELLKLQDNRFDKLLNDYHLNLLIPTECDVDLLQSELRPVMQVLAKSEDKEGLLELLETDPAFSDMSNDLAKVICEFTRLKKPRARKGRVNVCKAIEDFRKEIEETTAARVEAETAARVEAETTEKVLNKTVSIITRAKKGLLSVKEAATELGVSENIMISLM